MIYVARHGDDYRFDAGGQRGDDAMTPDALLYYGGKFPAPGDRPAFESFVEDLLAEMESMAGGADRCRWPLDAPWPNHTH